MEQLLDEEEILQETKTQNKKLLDFLTEPQSLQKLLDYITVEPDPEADNKRKFKYPFLACEILASDVWTICDAMYQKEELLDQLYTYFEQEPPLNVLLSTYAARVAAILLQKKVPETIAYLKSRKQIINSFLKHLGNSSVMDLLLKIIACEDTTDGNGTLEWLCTTDLISSLVDKFDPKQGAAVHENAAQTLGDIAAISINSASSPLIGQLESETVLTNLFKYLLSSGLSSSLEYGLSVLIELLRRHMNDGLDELTKLEDLPSLLKIIMAHIEPLHALINDEASRTKPIGFHRLKITEFFSALTHANYLCIDEELMRLGVFTTCVSLFFAHPWNNFLHSTVEQMIQVILDCESDKLKMGLLTECKLVDTLCEASRVNEEESNKPRGVRRGYMGHVTAITLSLLNAAANSPSIESYFADHKEWNEYIKGAFQATRDRENSTLMYAPDGFTTAEIIEDEYDNGEEYMTGEQEFRLEDDDDDDDEGVVMQSQIDEEDAGEVWEEKEIQDNEELETKQVEEGNEERKVEEEATAQTENQ